MPTSLVKYLLNREPRGNGDGGRGKIKETYNCSDELGFIKFGSRVDLFLPIGTKINTKIGDKVIGGQSILATY